MRQNGLAAVIVASGIHLLACLLPVADDLGALVDVADRGTRLALLTLVDQIEFV